MGMIRPITEISVIVAIPSQCQLPPPVHPTSLTTPSGPMPNTNATPQHLMVKEAKEVMKEPKQVMCQKESFLEAVGHNKSCKKLSSIMTTVCSVFKKEAWGVVSHHYSLNLEARDTRSLTNYRKGIVALLLINHAYLFFSQKDPTIMSPVNHPSVIETIYNTLWSTHLHKALSFDDLNNFDNLFLIGGIAVHNSLLEFQEEIYKSVSFSPTSPSVTEYMAIQNHNTIVHNMPTLVLPESGLELRFGPEPFKTRL
ncbi:hypothetical protein BDR07DRAFT_1492096 [Suillus spraguei]|nr:hypothetical protein BDR07DRAFT_1492096 [Suillus spraguei]